MLKYLIISMLCMYITAVSQAQEACKSVEDIVQLEAFSHQHVLQRGVSFSSNNFDVKYYRCEWTVDPSVRYIDGKVTVYYQLLNNTSPVQLDLMDDLQVDAVSQRASFLAFNHFSNILSVTLQTPLVGALDSFSISYHGVPPNTGFGSFIQSTHAGTPVMWTLSEPYGARDWWPCKNGLDDKADSIDVYLTYPSQYKGASNGLLQEETSSGTMSTSHWKHRYPIASYLVCFAVTNYSVFSNSVSLNGTNVPMLTYCFPESETSFRDNTPYVLDAMVLYSNLFGIYPFWREKYGHVQFGWGGGMEHQTSTFVINADESLTSHELAHQWFGDKITCASWRDIWLNEGFATHLSSWYMENKYPANALARRQTEIDNITSQPGGSVWVEDTTSVGRIFDSRLSYTKGSHLLYMLRWILGDSVFLKGVRAYQSDPALAYGFAHTADLQRNLQQVSGKDLDYFFKEWFYGQGYPSYTVKWTPVGTDYVKIAMLQTTSDPSVPLFHLPVGLTFKNATQQKTVVFDNTSNGQVDYKYIGFTPDTVLVDKDAWLITKNNKTEKVASIDGNTPDLDVFPVPARTEVFVLQLSGNITGSTVSLINSLGQTVYKSTLTSNTALTRIPLTNLSRGVYYIRWISASGQSILRKILKD
jgi:aminopeptidase N